MEKLKDEIDIPCYTIPALMAMGALSDTASDHHFRELLIAKCDSKMESFRSPCRIDAIIISVCTEGESCVVSNLREYTLTKGSMFVCGPKNILQVNSANNFHSDVLVVSPTLLRDSHINTKNMMPLFIEFGSHPCLPLSGADIMALHNLIKQIDTEVQVPSTTFFTAEVIGSLISAAISKIGDIMTRYMAQHPEVESLKRNRAEEYFKQFMLLLADHYKQERSVTFYARQMCITPKYLTTLIKRLSGKSVSGWIDDYVMLEAKTLLKYSTMGIQEISYYLNFPNQSFFGSYFKRNAGMSPSQYKIK